MKKLLFLVAIFPFLSFAQPCTIGESEVTVQITPDNYPNEISWGITNPAGTTLASGNHLGNTFCFPSNQCLTFTIYDSFGDGICCAYGIGSYSLIVDGITIATGGNYTFSESTSFNCPPGASCNSAITVSTGNYTAPNSNTWYSFQPTVPGIYEITTCFPSNTCDTKIWVYSTCLGLQWDNTNLSTIYYDDNNGGCGLQAVVSAALDPNDIYIIRIGDNNGACGSTSIDWALNFVSAISGCMDPNSCNYNPLATIPDICYYWPDANCPGGPDLVILQNEIEYSMYLDNIFASNCHVQENCLTGYGMRTILRFTTWIKNIGDVDYYIGNPTANPSQFSFVNCHNHAHYEGYAEYVLYRNNGQPIPIGFKNGFCVMDLECSGGGSFQYGCGNMGISSNCGDIYHASLDCQWIDITDVDPGSYTFAVKINWDQSPDALGRYETDYTNNWAQVCISIFENNGVKSFAINQTCPPYVDCAGVPFGNSVVDCNGDCGGSRLMGDLDLNQVRDTVDSQIYISEILSQSITPLSCNDLNNDNKITVWDAALAQHCFYHGTPFNNACVYPHGVLNTMQTTVLGIDTVNLSQNYVDIYIKNPLNFVLGYEFNVTGIDIINVIPLYNTTQYPVLPQHNASGKIIGLSYLDSVLAKNVNETPFVRIYFSAITDTEICISEIVHVVNKNYEAVNPVIEDGCKTVSGTTVSEIDASNYLFVWPNPAADNITVEAHITSKAGEITLMNIFGQEINKWSINSVIHRQSVSLQDLVSGVYLIKLTSGETQRVYRIIKE
ncbi:MAG: lysyl oxidase family protein [Flavobacteriales bacterium]